MNITTTDGSITIPFETAIALYRLGRFDAALLANCIPREVAERECPKILKDEEAIAFVAEMLRDADSGSSGQ